MPESNPPMDLLIAMRDLGIDDPLPGNIDARSRSALAAEIDQASRSRHVRYARCADQLDSSFSC
jgi:hypothetical protein